MELKIEFSVSAGVCVSHKLYSARGVLCYLYVPLFLSADDIMWDGLYPTKRMLPYWVKIVTLYCVYLVIRMESGFSISLQRVCYALFGYLVIAKVF